MSAIYKGIEYLLCIVISSILNIELGFYFVEDLLLAKSSLLDVIICKSLLFKLFLVISCQIVSDRLIVYYGAVCEQ